MPSSLHHQVQGGLLVRHRQILDVATDYAREGTCAHELAEFKVNKLLGIESANPTENLDYFDQEMADCTDDYAQYIAEQISKYGDPVVMVEQRLDFSKYVPDGFGTGDCVIVADEVLTVIDYKHGKGVAVSAEHNSQMMLYALGALELFDSLYDISEIKMVIFQPRLSNISEFNITTEELLDRGENTLKQNSLLKVKENSVPVNIADSAKLRQPAAKELSTISCLHNTISLRLQR